MIASPSAACRFISQDIFCSKPLACFGAVPRPRVPRAAQLTVSTTLLMIFATCFYGLHGHGQSYQYLSGFSCESSHMIPQRHDPAYATPAALYWPALSKVKISDQAFTKLPPFCNRWPLRLAKMCVPCTGPKPLAVCDVPRAALLL